MGKFRAVRPSSGSRPLTRSMQPVLFWSCGFMLALLVMLIFADYRVRPMVEASSSAVARRAATMALNDAVTAEIQQDSDFSKIVRIDKAKDGKMAAAHIDFAAVTDLQSAATERADVALRALSDTTLHLPWTQVVGGSLFTTFTPNIPVRMTLIGDAHSSVVMETKTEGVNQSVHTVYLDITADVNVVSPFVTSPISLQSRIPIAYVVLAGEVPNTYVGGSVLSESGQGASPSISLPH